ncbi:MAG: hypothetical protein ACFFCV_18225 [Promethearchaeota archaeon]
MLKRTRSLIIIILFLVIFMNIIFIPTNSDRNYINHNEKSDPKSAISQEGVENIILTYINRRVDLDLYGLTKIRDILTIENHNNKPISSILIGIPLNYSNNLVYFESSSVSEERLIGESTLLTDRLNMVMNEFEMFAVYFDSPLLPYQSKTIIFRQVLKDLIKTYYITDETGGLDHYINYKGLAFPILPYKLTGQIVAYHFLPSFSEGDEDVSDDWGTYNPGLNARVYDFETISSEIGDDFIEPFLTNLNDYKDVQIWVKHQEINLLEIEKITREIFISPWGIIRIRENVLLKNTGIRTSRYIIFNVPKLASELSISDDLGEILGTTVEPTPGTSTKQVSIDLTANRVSMISNTSFRFNIEYYLPFENYSSNNWFQESINIDTITTTFDYLGKDQTVKIIIDGCLKIDDISESPDAVKKSQGMITMEFFSDYISPGENKKIQFIFTIDIFNLLLRPFIFVFLILLIASIYVIIIKTRSTKKDIETIEIQYIPVNEIREYCSLNEEKNALILEIRQAEEDARRKKMAKKKYKNVLNKNNAKIDEIQKEIVPFKKILIESGEVFENIVKRLDILEAERISVKDSLALLESRYKRGRLPSRAAYLKLSDNFKKRRRKIDRTIDKLIQQLRSYLL